MVKEITKEGLFFSEHDSWKKKRRVLNSSFNFDFLKSLAPKIALLCDRVLEKIEEENGGIDAEGKIKYNVHNFSSRLAEDVILSCFFDSTLSNEKIEGLNVSNFVIKLLGDSFNFIEDVPFLLFGLKFIKLGLRSKDRDILRRISILRGWGNKIVKERVERINKEKLKQENPNDLIEAIVKNNLKEK